MAMTLVMFRATRLHQTLPMQGLEELAFTPTINYVLVKYQDGMMSVLSMTIV